jgi:3-oxoadipate enol-lactonase
LIDDDGGNNKSGKRRSGDTTDDGGALSLQKLARQVREVARSAGVDRFDLIGHSLGAAIAIQLAASSADLVRSLIVWAAFVRRIECVP